MQEWLPSFETTSNPISIEDLILFGDCYYLPYEEGPEAETLYGCLRALLSSDPVDWGDRTQTFHQRASQLLRCCTRIADLRHRPLFYALSRRVWELREELDLLEKYVGFKSQHPNGSFGSDFHLPMSYRSGMVSRLQRMFLQNDDGSFTPAPMNKAGQVIDNNNH